MHTFMSIDFSTVQLHFMHCASPGQIFFRLLPQFYFAQFQIFPLKKKINRNIFQFCSFQFFEVRIRFRGGTFSRFFSDCLSWALHKGEREREERSEGGLSIFLSYGRLLWLPM